MMWYVGVYFYSESFHVMVDNSRGSQHTEMSYTPPSASSSGRTSILHQAPTTTTVTVAATCITPDPDPDVVLEPHIEAELKAIKGYNMGNNIKLFPYKKFLDFSFLSLSYQLDILHGSIEDNFS